MSAPDHDRGDDNDLDEQRPEHDRKNPAVEDAPDPDEPDAQPFAGDDDIAAGHIGPDTPQQG